MGARAVAARQPAPVRIRIGGKRREIERRSGRAAARSADRRHVDGSVGGLSGDGLAAEHARRPRRVRLTRRIESIAAAAGG